MQIDRTPCHDQRHDAGHDRLEKVGINAQEDAVRECVDKGLEKRLELVADLKGKQASRSFIHTHIPPSVNSLSDALLPRLFHLSDSLFARFVLLFIVRPVQSVQVRHGLLDVAPRILKRIGEEGGGLGDELRALVRAKGKKSGKELEWAGG